MVQFYKLYPDKLYPDRQYPADEIGKDEIVNDEIGKQAVSRLEKRPLPDVVSSLPWGHLILLMQKIKDTPLREWCMHQTVANGWSRDTLGMMIQSQLHTRQGAAATNFTQRQSDLARQSLKDPYIFDFLTLTQPFTERELETGSILIVANLKEVGIVRADVVKKIIESQDLKKKFAKWFYDWKTGKFDKVKMKNPAGYCLKTIGIL